MQNSCFFWRATAYSEKRDANAENCVKMHDGEEKKSAYTGIHLNFTAHTRKEI